MSYGIQLEVWGDYALFTRPELTVERLSYDVMTPSAARGILEAILWKPAIRYVIDRIYVLSPIRFANIKRNEIKEKIPAGTAKSAMENPEKVKDLFLDTASGRTQRSSGILTNVRYVIEAHFEMTDKAGENDTPAKFDAMLGRRVDNGQCFHQPYFGCREFPAHFRRYEGDQPVPTAYANQTKDLGMMLFDMDFSEEEGIRPQFFRAVLANGVLDVQDCEVLM